MFFHAVSAFSETSASAAISSAIAEASGAYNKDAKSVHVIVTGVFQLDGGWKASVRVVVEADLEEELEEYLESKGIHYDAKDHKPEVLESGLGLDDIYELEELDPEFYVYFPSIYEPVYEEFNMAEPEMYAHLIESEAMWENIQDYFLDVEFYEATHIKEPALHSSSSEGVALNKDIKRPDVKPREKKLRNQLDLELES